jgi:hypothetical protein
MRTKKSIELVENDSWPHFDDAPFSIERMNLIVVPSEIDDETVPNGTSD